MEADGKIFVVVAVLSIILIGIFFYLFVLDKKIGKIEREIEERNHNTTE